MKSTKKLEDISIEEIEKKIIEFKINLSQVEAILEREKESKKLDSTRLDDLIKLQKDLKAAILYQEENRKFKISTSSTSFNNNPLFIEDAGKICSAYYESENTWFTAMINNINLQDLSAEITWLGYKEKETLPFKFIKINEPLKKEELEVGMMCEAIYYEDGKWYNGTIEMISEHGVHVKYSKYNDIEVVSFDSIRITPEQKLIFNKKKENQKNKHVDDDLEFKIPEYLKITPADNEMQRLSKKKRVKSMKNTHKQKLIEKVNKEKQDEWINFSSKNKKKGFGASLVRKTLKYDNILNN
jgi:hypothetical protein